MSEEVKPTRILHFSAKCSDLSSTEFDAPGLSFEQQGYANCPFVGSGDYIDFSFDMDTGKIIGWQPMTNLEIVQCLDDDGSKRVKAALRGKDISSITDPEIEIKVAELRADFPDLKTPEQWKEAIENGDIEVD